MDVQETVKKNIIRRIMLLSHELGRELSVEEVEARAQKLRKYLREQEDMHIDIEYALNHMRKVLEKAYGDKYDGGDEEPSKLDE